MKQGPKRPPRTNRSSGAATRDVHRRDRRHLAIIVLTAFIGAAWFLYAEREVAGAWGYSLDDSWIYATYARNLASGNGYTFNPGEHVAGATGPLYVFLLSALYLLFHDMVLPSKAVGILCLAASGVVIYKTARIMAPRGNVAALLAGILTVASAPLLWGSVSGLEIPVYLLLTCVGIHFYASRRWTLCLLSWSLGVWLRPDGLLLVLLGLLLRPKVALRSSIGPIAAAAVVLGPYFIFNAVVGGAVLPNSVPVSAQAGANILSRQWAMLRQWAEMWGIGSPSHGVGWNAALVLPGMVVGAVLGFRKYPALVAYLVLFPFALAFHRAWGGQFGRYIVYSVPIGMLLAAIGFEWLSLRAFGERNQSALWILLVACLAWQGYSAFKVGIVHGWNVQNINGMQKFIAQSTRRVTSPGDTVAVNDVGAMGYFSGCYILDLVGLVSPPRPFPENLSLYRPKLLVIFPDWFEKFASLDPQTNQVVFYDGDSTYKYSPVIGVGLRRNTISSRNTMYLYERLPRNGEGASRVEMVIH